LGQENLINCGSTGSKAGLSRRA